MSEKLDIKLLALDMDGTTYKWGGDIIPENIPAIQEAQRNDVEVVIVTGRPALAPQNQFIENGFAKYGKSAVIACNGGCTYDFKNNKLLAESPVDTETAKKVFELPHTDPELKDVEVWGYVDDLKTVISTKVEKHSEGFDFESRFFKGKYVFYEDLPKFDYKFFKLLAFNVNDKLIKTLKDMGFEIAINKKGDACEINAHGVDKGSAVLALAKANGIKREQVMSIGDGANDLPMIEAAGYGVSMTNSIQAIKDVAQINLPVSNEEAAVKYAIDKYILGK